MRGITTEGIINKVLLKESMPISLDHNRRVIRERE
jgi:hypothetical protein